MKIIRSSYPVNVFNFLSWKSLQTQNNCRKLVYFWKLEPKKLSYIISHKCPYFPRLLGLCDSRTELSIPFPKCINLNLKVFLFVFWFSEEFDEYEGDLDRSASSSSLSTLRRILDQRRILVMELFKTHGYFPTGRNDNILLTSLFSFESNFSPNRKTKPGSQSLSLPYSQSQSSC